MVRTGRGRKKEVFEEIRKKGHAREEFTKATQLTTESSPVEFFESFLPVFQKHPQYHKTSVGDWTTWSNAKALLANAGQPGGLYPEFKPFKVKEVKKFLALFMFQGLSPSPRVEMKFSTQGEDPVNGNDLVFRCFGKEGSYRLKHFKKFFAVQDPLRVIPPRDIQPNWKVEYLFDHNIFKKACLLCILAFLLCLIH